MTGELLPAPVPPDPDDEGAVLALLGLAAVTTADREERGVDRHRIAIAIGADLLFFRFMGEGIERRSRSAHVLQPLGARHALALRIDEGVVWSPEPGGGRCVAPERAGKNMSRVSTGMK